MKVHQALLKISLLLLLYLFWGERCQAQLPDCHDIYMLDNNTNRIYTYNPSQPISATNPSLNTIVPPPYSGGLTVSAVLGSTDPTLTFYICTYNDPTQSDDAVYYYYDPKTSSWVNTGHFTGNFYALNIAAGGGYIYSLDIVDGQVYRYDGKSDGKLLFSDPSLNNVTPVDLVADCDGNCYVLNVSWDGDNKNSFLRAYDSTGVLVKSWKVDISANTNASPGAGFAIIGDSLYTDDDNTNGIDAFYLGDSVLTLVSIRPQPVQSFWDDFGSCSQSVAIKPVVTVSTPNTSICGPQPVTFTASIANGGKSPTLQWYVNGTKVGTGASTYKYTALTGDKISCMLTSSATCAANPIAYSDTVTMTVNPLTSSVNITSTKMPVCVGTNITFTATPTNGGTLPTYQWQVNGNTTAGTGNIFSTSGLVNNDAVRCIMASNAACLTTNTDTSNVITIIEDTLAIPAINIAASQSVICSGTTVNFTATATNGGSSPTFQWTLNGNPVGTNSSTYSNTALGNNDAIWCVFTSSIGCVTRPMVTSDTVVMRVTTSATPAITVTASQNNICAGNPVSYTAATVNGGTSPGYQWYVNGTAVGSDTSTYEYKPTDGDKISCVLTSNASCAVTPNAFSDTVTMLVNASTASVNITSTKTSICSGTAVTFTAAATNGGTHPIYQWQVDGNNVTSNNNTYTSTALNNNDIVECIFISSATCVTSSDTSNAISVVVSTPVTPSINVAVSQTKICSGTDVTFTATTTNGGNVPSFQWQVNGNAVGSDSSQYSSASLGNNDAISCVLTSSVGCVSSATATSDTIVMQVTPTVTPLVTITASQSSICAGKPVTFTAVATNGGTSPIYQWQLDENNTGTNSSTYTNTDLQSGNMIHCLLTSNAACLSQNGPVASNDVSVTIYPNPVVTSEPDTTIETGSSIVLNLPVTGDIATYTWTPPTALDNDTIAKPIATPLEETLYTLQVVSTDGCPASGQRDIKVFKTLLMPTAFTPNGDGHNDVFRIPPFASAIKINYFIVFNRAGQKIFSTQDASVGWDGTFNSQPQPPGTYVWMLQYVDPVQHTTQQSKGTIVLIR